MTPREKTWPNMLTFVAAVIKVLFFPVELNAITLTSLTNTKQDIDSHQINDVHPISLFTNLVT